MSDKWAKFWLAWVYTWAAIALILWLILPAKALFCTTTYIGNTAYTFCT